MGEIRAIETSYRGHRFRSRLEARWAVVFDALDYRWDYEPEGFETSAGRYLPDFYLPDHDVWAEVKGGPLSVRDADRCLAFAASVAEKGARFRLLGPIPASVKAGTIAIASAVPELLHVGRSDLEGWLRSPESDGALSPFPRGVPSDFGTGQAWTFVPGFWLPATTSEKVHAALAAGRRARFEHGETPR